jgi:flagellar L-ring protein precursor FlgH
LVAAVVAGLVPGAAAQATAPAATPPTEAVAPQRPVRQSWTSDRRAFAVGDVITVLVDEMTVASANQSDVAYDRRRRDMDVFAAGSGLADALPATGARIGTTNDADSRRRGDALRQNRFRGEVSVRVVAIDPTTGLLQVQGEKLVNVDRNRQQIELTGWVRPQDVSSANLVDSWRVADAQLVYASKGSLGKPKGGIISRILGALWP